ncbi:hypothetical protein Tco_0632946 [Tanacetum coccineum]
MISIRVYINFEREEHILEREKEKKKREKKKRERGEDEDCREIECERRSEEREVDDAGGPGGVVAWESWARERGGRERVYWGRSDRGDGRRGVGESWRRSGERLEPMRGVEVEGWGRERRMGRSWLRWGDELDGVVDGGEGRERVRQHLWMVRHGGEGDEKAYEGGSMRRLMEEEGGDEVWGGGVRVVGEESERVWDRDRGSVETRDVIVDLEARCGDLVCEFGGGGRGRQVGERGREERVARCGERGGGGERDERMVEGRGMNEGENRARERRRGAERIRGLMESGWEVEDVLKRGFGVGVEGVSSVGEREKRWNEVSGERRSETERVGCESRVIEGIMWKIDSDGGIGASVLGEIR